MEGVEQVISRIGLDGRMTRQMSVGMKTYAREVIGRLPRVAPEFEYAFFERGANFGYDEQIRLPLAMRRSQLDLMHFMSLYVPLIATAPSVITIHDLIHLRYPQYFKSKVRSYYDTVVRLACARAKRVITDDERTVDDLERFLRVDRAKVRVIPLGVTESFLRAGPPAAPPARPYLLYVGNHRLHKDLPTLFEAWSGLPDGTGLDLHLTGPDDFDGELLRRKRADCEIVALGDLSEERLIGEYAGARALLQPALCEGFGLPMLEAMAVGCPVIASTGAVPRVLEPAALTFATGDAAALRGRIVELLGDGALRTRLIDRGRELAQTLTWDHCTRATADLYREVLEER
jgi:glycosyltransferase involved in cell wall biosynthesis